MDNINNVIGTQLKLARTATGWSLDVASQRCGVSKAMLGQIERGESSPTVARLWIIASGFELPLSYFFGALSSNNSSDRQLNTEQGISISTLFPFDDATKTEVFCLTLAPQHQQLSSPHNKGVVEHIVVIEGELECFFDQGWHHLAQGQVAKFNANQAHGYRNPSQHKTVFHNMICYT